LAIFLAVAVVVTPIKTLLARLSMGTVGLSAHIFLAVWVVTVSGAVTVVVFSVETKAPTLLVSMDSPAVASSARVLQAVRVRAVCFAIAIIVSAIEALFASFRTLTTQGSAWITATIWIITVV